MKKYFALILLFACLGVKGQQARQHNTPNRVNSLAGYDAKQNNIADTPQADRNPNDFYDTIPIISIITVDPYTYDDKGVIYKNGKPYGIKAKQLSLEEKLLMYASECWGDSTLKEVPYVCFPGCAVYHLPEKKYIHREPTLEGFIEYLKKK